jgi:hypothetical protein
MTYHVHGHAMNPRISPRSGEKQFYLIDHANHDCPVQSSGCMLEFAPVNMDAKVQLNLSNLTKNTLMHFCFSQQLWKIYNKLDIQQPAGMTH